MISGSLSSSPISELSPPSDPSSSALAGWILSSGVLYSSSSLSLLDVISEFASWAKSGGLQWPIPHPRYHIIISLSTNLSKLVNIPMDQVFSHTLTHSNWSSHQLKIPALGMETANLLFAHKKRQGSNDMLESHVPDQESQMHLRGHLLGPSQSGPIYRSQNPPASQDLIQTIVQRKTPHDQADYCYLDQKSSLHDRSQESTHTKMDDEHHCMPLAWHLLRSGRAYGLTLVRRRFWRRCSRYCCRRCWVRLGPSVGKVYVLGAEGYSGQNRGNTDWEAWKPMQL